MTIILQFWDIKLLLGDSRIMDNNLRLLYASIYLRKTWYLESVFQLLNAWNALFNP